MSIEAENQSKNNPISVRAGTPAGTETSTCTLIDTLRRPNRSNRTRKVEIGETSQSPRVSKTFDQRSEKLERYPCDKSAAQKRNGWESSSVYRSSPKRALSACVMLPIAVQKYANAKLRLCPIREIVLPRRQLALPFHNPTKGDD